MMMSDLRLTSIADPDSAADLAELAIRIKCHAVPENPVIFYGSSSFRLWDPTIRKDLDSNSIVNLAFGGSTLVSCNDHFEKIMAPYPEARSMVIYAGDNDLGNGRSAVAVRDGFLRILDKIEKRFGQIAVFFVSIKPSPSKQMIFDTIVQSNRLVRQEAVDRSNLHYVDIFTPMLTRSGESNPEFFLPDMLHMNQAGYQVWRTVIMELRDEIGL